MAKKLYSDLDFQNSNRNTNLPKATDDGHSTQWGQSKYAVRKNDAFTKNEFDDLCKPGNDCILARYEVNAGNYSVSGSNVTELFDLSGNGRHLRQFASPANRPTILSSAFPGGADTNGLNFSVAGQYLRSEDALGNAITHDLPGVSLAAIAVIGEHTGGPHSLLSWTNPTIASEDTSPWAILSQSGAAAQTCMQVQIGFTGGRERYGLGPQFNLGRAILGPHGVGAIFRNATTTGNVTCQPFLQSWDFEPRSTGTQSIGNIQTATWPAFPITGKSIYLGLSRFNNTTINCVLYLKAIVIVNLASSIAQVEGVNNPHAFLKRISGHYVYHNSWGLNYNL